MFVFQIFVLSAPNYEVEDDVLKKFMVRLQLYIYSLYVILLNTLKGD